MNCIVYMASSNTSGFSFIGGHAGDLDEAKAHNLVQAEQGSNDQFHRAIRSMGPDDFSWEVLEEADGASGLSALVKTWIEREGTAERGYNLSGRASTSSPSAIKTRAPMSDETKQKISEAKKGKTRGPMSRETRMKLSKAQKGKKHNLETRAKIAASHRNKKHSIETRMKIAAKSREYWAKVRTQKAVQETVDAMRAEKATPVTPDAPQTVTEALRAPQKEEKKLFTPPPTGFFRPPPKS